LVVKTIKEKEFVEFHKFASEYLEYVKRAKAKSLDSLLAKIFGLYEVTIRNKTYKCIVMQNIFFGLHNVTKVYDLKGSEVNRL
jgi:1-phosphatidylinositol-3-phosphate 5-kinase